MVGGLSGLIGLVFGGILVWVLRPTFKKFGNGFGRSLSRLGSDRSFRQRYLAQLIEEYRGLNVRSPISNTAVTVELERVFVSRLPPAVPNNNLGHEERPILGIGQAVAQHQRLVILGGPGMGKTTLLTYLTLSCARGQARERLGIGRERLPIFIPLRRIKLLLNGEGAGTLSAFLTRQYTELGMRPPKGFFEKTLRQGRCLVLLDGLGEVVDATERRRMSEWVDRLVTIHPRNRFIVTSRALSYESAPLESGFTVLHIRDFSPVDIRHFVAKWCLAVEIEAQGDDGLATRRLAWNEAQDLAAAIESNEDIGRLAANPLLLSLIVLAHRYRARLPRRRVDLLDECLDMLLGHWDEAKGVVSVLSPSEKRVILQSLAFHMHKAARIDITQGDLQQFIEGVLPQDYHQRGDAVSIIDEIRDGNGLLAELEPGIYAFSHITFQEYLVAREIVDKETRRELLLDKVGDKWWEEVVLLYAGMAEVTPIVEALLAGEDDSACSRLLLAGRCVTASPRMGDPARFKVIRRLEEKLETSTGALFLRIGQVMAEIAGEDNVDFFLRLARDDPFRREVALASLGQMVRQPNDVLCERAMERLLTHFYGKDLRREAGEALVEAWFGGKTDELEGYLSSAQLARMASVLAEAMDDTMVTIPAGEFQMGDEKRRVYVDAFQMGKYAITNTQYKRFVEATGHPPPTHWEDHDYSAGKALHPVVFVSWHDADAYARWAGKRLPTEEEWEKAARGTFGREYPWGSWEEGCCNTREAGVGDTTPVGQYSPQGDSPYGCVDMAGNVWEWTAAPWSISTNPLVRGGSWNYLQGVARCTYRIRHSPESPNGELGFRLAASSNSL